VLRDPEVGVRKVLMSKWVFKTQSEHSNVIYGNNSFSPDLPPHITLERLQALQLPRLHRFSLKVPWHLLTRRFDLVVTAMLGSFPTLCASVIGKGMRGTPYVVIAENWYPRRNPFINWTHRKVAHRAELVVAQSTAAYRYFLDVLGVPPARVVLCVNSLGDLTSLPHNAPLTESLRQDPTVKILCVGRFVEFKGQDQLIEEFIRLDRPDARLILVGNHDTPFGHRCRSLAQNHPHIRFEGKRKFRDVLAFYRGCDLFVMANRFTDDPVESAESWGYAPMEAAQFGLPLVLTDATGCTPDVIEDGVTGFRVPAGDGDSLRDAMRQLLSDRRRRDAMGEAVRNHVRPMNGEESIREFSRAFNRLLASDGAAEDEPGHPMNPPS